MTIAHTIQKLEKSAIKLTLTISKDDANKEYQALLSRYVQNAVLPGFRRGKVPASVLEKKFGEGLLAEALQRLIDEALHEVFETIEEKPLTYSQPQLLDHNMTLDLGHDITFSIQYDAFPHFVVGQYKGIEVEEPEVSLTEEDEARELERLRQNNAVVVDKAVDSVEKGDVVTISFVEVVDGAELAGTLYRDFVFEVGSGANYYLLDDELLDMKRGEEKLVEKTYSQDVNPVLAGTTRTIKVKLSAIKERKLPELNDELAQDISEEYNTLDDLKKAIHERLEKQLKISLRVHNITSILNKIVEQTTIELPQSMINAELERCWQSLASKNRLSVDQLNKTIKKEEKAKIENEWIPQVETALRQKLIMEKVIEMEGIKANEEDIKEEILKNVPRTKEVSFDKIKAQLESNDYLRYIEQQVLDRLVFDFLLSQANIKKGKQISYCDLLEQKAGS